jgi:hypothetical protein
LRPFFGAAFAGGAFAAYSSPMLRAQRINQTDDVRRGRRQLLWLRRQASPLPSDHLDDGFLVMIDELRRVEFSFLGPDNAVGELQHLGTFGHIFSKCHLISVK